MPDEVTIREAKTHLSRLVRRANAMALDFNEVGEELVETFGLAR